MKRCWPLTGCPEPTKALLQESADSDSFWAQIKRSSQRSYDEKKRQPDCKTLRQRATAFILSLVQVFDFKSLTSSDFTSPWHLRFELVSGPVKRRGCGRLGVGSVGRRSGWHGPAMPRPRNVLPVLSAPVCVPDGFFLHNVHHLCEFKERLAAGLCQKPSWISFMLGM